MNGLRWKLKQRHAQWIEWRRFLHQFPELSFHEKETTSFVARLLREWGIPFRFGDQNLGIIAEIKGEYPGSTVALRADMDALPIQDQKQVNYRSQTPQVMHACGHDAHTSILLGIAQWFQEHRSELRGNIRLIFQHAEEVTPGGALSLIRSGALDGVDVIYGIHLWTPLQVGHFASARGSFMAAADEFTIEIVGKGGHAGLPHEAVDSIVIGSQLVQHFQTIVSRMIDPAEPAVISVASFHGGSSFNIIAERSIMEGTVRTFSEQARHFIQNRMRDIAEHVVQIYGAELNFHYEIGYPPVVNHAIEFDRFERIALQHAPSDNVHRMPYVMAGEDFSYYLQQVPGCFMFVGAGNAEKGIIYPHHHPMFDIDEDAMLYGAELLVTLSLDYLEGRKP